jgi:hypothetical protein
MKGENIMKKIVHREDGKILLGLPVEVSAKVEEIAGILDENYGENRDWDKDLGGYILICESEQDVSAMNELIDFEYVLPEYVELVRCKNGEDYTNSLMILSSDYSVSLLIPLRLTPINLLECMDAKVEGGLRA